MRIERFHNANGTEYSRAWFVVDGADYYLFAFDKLIWIYHGNEHLLEVVDREEDTPMKNYHRQAFKHIGLSFSWKDYYKIQYKYWDFINEKSFN